MQTNEKISVAFFVIGFGLIFGPELPEFIEGLQRTRDKFMELNPRVVLACFGVLCLFIATAFQLYSYALIKAETAESWPDNEDPEEGTRTTRPRHPRPHE